MEEFFGPLDKSKEASSLSKTVLLDVPDKSFTGPF
jgi:hypothetical protein